VTDVILVKRSDCTIFQAIAARHWIAQGAIALENYKSLNL
jgi:hypothetical protein